jgi:hypothetical protein
MHKKMPIHLRGKSLEEMFQALLTNKKHGKNPLTI